MRRQEVIVPLVIVGVMGPGEGATARDREDAYQLGRAIAQEGWSLVTGGRNEGVMDSASRGAKEAGGLTIGVLPSSDKNGVSRFVDVPIVTGMGEARNNINVLSSDIVFACGMRAGTASEVALALKARRHVILLNVSDQAARFFVELDPNRVHVAADATNAVNTARHLLNTFASRNP
jgi:uncharacterized protein (TIGR00725 family)